MPGHSAALSVSIVRQATGHLRSTQPRPVAIDSGPGWIGAMQLWMGPTMLGMTFLRRKLKNVQILFYYILWNKHTYLFMLAKWGADTLIFYVISIPKKKINAQPFGVFMLNFQLNSPKSKE